MATATELKEAVPSPLTLREMLETMAIKELLGPVGGKEEEVDERIRDRYLVGILSPNKKAEEWNIGSGEWSVVNEEKEGYDEDEEDLATEPGDFPPGDELAIEGVGRGSASGDDGPSPLVANRMRLN